MYSLYALVGRTNEVERAASVHPHIRIVRLGGGLSMVPLGEELVQHIQRSSAGASPPTGSVSGAFEFLSPAIEAWARSLSMSTAIAYFETEYFSGEGFERSVLWAHGEISLGPFEGAGSINAALKALGVVATPGVEEFEYVGLGRHRTLDEWLAEAT